MIKKYKIEITADALSDMESIYNYIAYMLQSPETAKRQYDRIANAILALETFPKKYSVFDFEPERTWEMRKMKVDNYLVCFIADEDTDTVTITAVLYGASDLKTKLSKRQQS